MSFAISNLSVNNVPASDEVRITDDHFIVSWTFAGDPLVITTTPAQGISAIINPDQGAYEIRLGTSSLNTGISAYAGDTVQTGTVVTPQMFYRFNGPSLSRTTRYYGQIRLRDKYGNWTDWTTFTIYYNTQPSVSSVLISPSSPLITDTLTLSYVFTDSDGDTESGSRIRWFVNGVQQRDLEGRTTVSPDYLHVGDVWMADVLPSDGYEKGIAIGSASTTITSTPSLFVLSNPKVLPESPASNCPLYASVNFSGTESLVINWYINGQLNSDAQNNRFFRFDLSVGDQVYFTAEIPSVGGSSLVTSDTVTIGSPRQRVYNLKINGSPEPLALESLSPTITWEVIAAPGSVTSFASLAIGSSPGDSDIYSTIEGINDNKIVLPVGLLNPGQDYWVSVAVGATTLTLGPTETAHFRLKGSLWENSVNNSVGWTVETYVKVTGTSGYQGIRIADGAKFCEIHFTTTAISLVSVGVTQSANDFTEWCSVTVVGIGATAKVYVNHQFVFSAALVQETSDKYIEFGAIGNDASQAQYSTFRYTVLGAYYPDTSSEFSNFYNEVVVDFPTREITALALDDGNKLVGTVSDDLNGDVLVYNSNRQVTYKACVSRTYSPINRIVQSPDGTYTYFCHANGATFFKGYPFAAYSDLLDLTTTLPDADGWYATLGGPFTPSTTSLGLAINTTRGGKWFYAQDRHGTSWFDSVDNNVGWTVDVTLTAQQSTDDHDAQNTPGPEGFGIYVNDGEFYEVVNVFGNEIVLGTSGVSSTYDTTVSTNLRLVGLNDHLEVWAKPATTSTYSKIAESSLSFRGTQEGNAGRPSITEDSNGVSHVVWHDDGQQKGRQVYYSKLVSGEWTTPVVIVPVAFNASNPQIISSPDGKLYVVFEQRIAEYTSIGIVIANKFGWGAPDSLIDSGSEAKNPRIAIDGHYGICVVWEDYRNLVAAVRFIRRDPASGNWADAIPNGTGGMIVTTDVQVNSTASGCYNPAIDALGDYIVMSWTQNLNANRNQIFAKVLSFDGSGWSPNREISDASTKSADHSDVILHDSYVHVVWHDNSVSNYSIFAHKLNRSLTSVTSIQNLLDVTVAARFPSFGQKVGGKVVVIYERDNVTATAAFSADVPPQSDIYAALYTTTSSTWQSSGQTGSDIHIDFSDSRYSYRPRIAKRFLANANIVYETDLVSDFDEQQLTKDTFRSVRDAVYTLATGADYIATTTSAHDYDLMVSGQLPRKEIRFGDFSDSYKGVVTFARVGIYLPAAVPPFEIGIVSSGTSLLTDDRSYDALVNNNGDAWLGTQSGLAFFFKAQNRIAIMQDTATGPTYAIAIDRNGVLFVATADGSGNPVFVKSDDHVAFQSVTFPGIAGNVKDMVFDTLDRLWIATDAGVYGYSIETQIAQLLPNQALTATLVDTITTTQGLPSNKVAALAWDEARNVLWIATDSGLASYDGDNTQVFTTDNSALLSNRVNGIAIRDGSHRYVATSAGVCEMKGTRFTRLVASDDNHWNNNVRSILWKAPNILYVSTLSDICQIQLDDETNQHRTLVFGIANYAYDATAYDDLRTFYLLDTVDASGLVEADPDPDAYLEVYVNGVRMPNGFIASTDNKIIQFENPLNVADLVYVKVRNDLSTHATLQQNPTELAVAGKIDTRIESLVLVGTDVYARVTVNGSPQLYKYVEAGLALPYDKIGLDTHPPTGRLKIVKQVSRYDLLLDIEYAADNLSGIGQMKLSNFANMTTDGVTPQPAIDFATSVIHTIDATVDNVQVSLPFDSTTGAGVCITKFAGSADNTYYAGTKGPATIQRFDTSTSAWMQAILFDTNSEASVDMLFVFGNTMVVAVGKTAGTTRLYQTSDGITYTYLASISAPHVYAACMFSGNMYFGDSEGKVYVYDNVNPPVFKWDVNQPTIWAMQSANQFIFVATGDNGNLVSIDVNNNSLQVIYTSTDPNLTAIDTLTGTKTRIYIGTGTSGEILSRDVTGGIFTNSFKSIPSRVSQIEIDAASMRVCIGDTIYTATAIPTFSGWTPLTTLPSDILGLVPSSLTGDPTTIELWVITAEKVYRVAPDSGNKFIYLQLIDNAGNVSAPDLIFDKISISSLSGFVNANRILTLDQFGNQLDSIEGNVTFFSGQQISTESGEYYSEVFFGTNNLISWDMLTWEADVPAGTEVTLYIRAANSRDGVLTSLWQASFTSNYQSGANISTVMGKYIQFRALLSSTVAGVTPTLKNVVIRSKASDATHFFTTNFVLGSRIAGGLLTAQTVVPVTADIVFGINTTNSTDFNDYQIITPDKIFTMDPSQSGEAMRVGIKFITPTPGYYATDNYTGYSPYSETLEQNVVNFYHSVGGTWHYKLTFYSDFAMTDQVYETYTFSSQTGWTADSAAFPSTGNVVVDTIPSLIMYVPDGNTPLVCNTFYFIHVEAYDANSLDHATIISAQSFISACNTTFVDTIAFSYTSDATQLYQFRVRFYADPERLMLLKTYYTGTNASIWTINAGSFSSSGETINNGDTAALTLSPVLADFSLDTHYYLSIDVFDGSSFTLVTNDYTFRVSDPASDVYCGGYENVPIVKNFGIMLSMADGSLIPLNM